MAVLGTKTKIIDGVEKIYIESEYHFFAAMWFDDEEIIIKHSSIEETFSPTPNRLEGVRNYPNGKLLNGVGWSIIEDIETEYENFLNYLKNTLNKQL